MRKALWLSCSLAMVLGLMGCGSDAREVQVSKTLKQLEDAANNVGRIKAKVEAWEKEPQKTQLLKDAVDDTEGLKKNGQALQEIKQENERLEPPSKEEKEEFAKGYRNKLTGAVDRLNKEQIALNQALARAEKINKAALAELNDKLRLAQREFEVLTRPR